MSEHDTHINKAFTERDQESRQAILLEILPAIEGETSEERVSVIVGTEYVDNDGNLAKWKRTVPVSALEAMGNIARDPEPLPDVDENTMKPEDRELWRMRKAWHDFAVANKRSHASLYAAALLHDDLKRINNHDIENQIIDQLVTASQEMDGALRAIE